MFLDVSWGFSKLFLQLCHCQSGRPPCVKASKYKWKPREQHCKNQINIEHKCVVRIAVPRWQLCRVRQGQGGAGTLEHPTMHRLINSFFLVSIWPPLAREVYHSCIHPLINSFMHSFLHHTFVHSFNHSFIPSLICPFIHYILQLWVACFISSSIQSFIRWLRFVA